MWLLCLECGISSGCGCHTPAKRKKYIPRDYEKEAKRYEEDLLAEVAPKYKPLKKKDEK